MKASPLTRVMFCFMTADKISQVLLRFNIGKGQIVDIIKLS